MSTLVATSDSIADVYAASSAASAALLGGTTSQLASRERQPRASTRHMRIGLTFGARWQPSALLSLDWRGLWNTRTVSSVVSDLASKSYAAAECARVTIDRGSMPAEAARVEGAYPSLIVLRLGTNPPPPLQSGGDPGFLFDVAFTPCTRSPDLDSTLFSLIDLTRSPIITCDGLVPLPPPLPSPPPPHPPLAPPSLPSPSPSPLPPTSPSPPPRPSISLLTAPQPTPPSPRPPPPRRPSPTAGSTRGHATTNRPAAALVAALHASVDRTADAFFAGLVAVGFVAEDAPDLDADLEAGAPGTGGQRVAFSTTMRICLGIGMLWFCCVGCCNFIRWACSKRLTKRLELVPGTAPHERRQARRTVGRIKAGLRRQCGRPLSDGAALGPAERGKVAAEEQARLMDDDEEDGTEVVDRQENESSMPIYANAESSTSSGEENGYDDDGVRGDDTHEARREGERMRSAIPPSRPTVREEAIAAPVPVPLGSLRGPLPGCADGRAGYFVRQPSPSIPPPSASVDRKDLADVDDNFDCFISAALRSQSASVRQQSAVPLSRAQSGRVLGSKASADADDEDLDEERHLL